MTLAYTVPTVASPALPKLESWTECRCPACVPLGWDSARLLFKVRGVMAASGAIIETRCSRCKSLVAYEIGTPNLRAIEQGPKNDKKRKVAFE